MDFKPFFGIRGGASVVPLSDRREDLSSNDIHSDIGHPEASKVGSLFVVILGSSICFAAFTQRVTAINNWRKVPFITWVALILYLSAFTFFMSSALFEFPLGIDQNFSACSATAALCLFNYVFAKNVRHLEHFHRFQADSQFQCYFLFLIDRVHIIRGSVCHRLKSKLYVCNIIATIGSYIGYNALYSTFKLSEVDHGICVIGRRRAVVITSIAFDVAIYLTLLFLIPLYRSYSFRRSLWQRPNGSYFITIDSARNSVMDKRLRQLAIRTFLGTCCTAAFTVANLSTIAALHGEPAWMCFLTCRIDILVEVLVVFALTRPENVTTVPSRSSTIV